MSTRGFILGTAAGFALAAFPCVAQTDCRFTDRGWCAVQDKARTEKESQFVGPINYSHEPARAVIKPLPPDKLLAWRHTPVDSAFEYLPDRGYIYRGR